MTRRRIVVTGLGLVTPLGNSVADTWTNLLAGQSGIDHVTRFDASNLFGLAVQTRLNVFGNLEIARIQR